MARGGLRIPEKRELKERYSAHLSAFEHVLDELHRELTEQLASRSIHVTVKTRVKSFESSYRKLLRRLASDTEIHPSRADGDPVFGLTDVLGVRIVCPFLEQVQTACSVVRGLFEILDEDEKGAERSFREFGYQSIHFLIRVPDGFRSRGDTQDGWGRNGNAAVGATCEIQVCTLLQDAWAEVEHEIIYKAEFTPFDEPLRRKLAALNANLTLSDIIFQEIREYQRQLHGELQRRRDDFLKRVLPNGTSGEAPPPDAHPAEARDGREQNGDIVSIPATAHAGGSGVTDSLDDLLLKALYAHNAKSYHKAIDLYTTILGSRPSRTLEAIVLAHRGMAYFADSRLEQALVDFSAAIKADPQNGKAFYYRGTVFRMKDDYRKALRDFDRSLELNPFEFDTLIGRSRILLKIGDCEKALEDCEAALRMEPDAEEARALREQVMDELKRDR